MPSSSTRACRASRYVVERLGLPARAVEGEHQLLSRPLTKRMLGDDGLELAHQLGVPSGGEVAVDSLLEAAEVQLVETGDLGLRKIRVGELRERRAAPERECLARLPVFQVSLEPREVELVRVNSDQVAGRLREQALGVEHLPQLRDVDLERLLRRFGWLVLPECVGEALGGDDLVRMQEEHCQEGAVLGARQGDDTFPVDHVERAEDPEFHCRATVPLPNQPVLQGASAPPNPVLTEA